jgi:hypothetical protein
MTGLSLPQPPLERDVDDLEPFFEAVRSSNPFVDNRVNGLSSDGVDVDDIHRAAFERLTALAREAVDLRRGVGAMLWGEAGIGKSHLLARLARWAEHDRQAVAVYLHNLQASPENLPRSLLKAVVSILTRGQVRGFGRTPLFDLTFAFVAEALHFDTTHKHRWSVAERAYGGLVDRLGAEDPSRAALVNRTVFEVLYCFFRSAYRAAKTGDEREASLAVRWMSGDSLDPAEARQLGLPPGRSPDEPASLTDNQQIKQVLVALSRMALSRERPFLLCFDQVDNLDDDQAAALSRFLEALLDSAPGLLVVTAGVQSSLLRWRETKVIQDSAWDRLAQEQVLLLRLTTPESRRILAARLAKFLTPFVESEPVRQRLQQDDLFPLGRAWSEAFFRDRIDLRPRDTINGAREGWRREQEALRRLGGPVWLRDGGSCPPEEEERPRELTAEQLREAIDRKVTDKIEDHCGERRRRPESLAPDAANLAGLIAVLLEQFGGVEIDRPPSGTADREFPYSLVARRRSGGEGAEVRTGVFVLVDGSAASTTKVLRWLKEASPPPERVLIVTDERRPVAFGAQRTARGREYYEELRRRGPSRFLHIPLTFEEYARLDALQAVVGMARSGDLELVLPDGRTRPVSVDEVLESHRRQRRHLGLPVLQELLAEPGG